MASEIQSRPSDPPVAGQPMSRARFLRLAAAATLAAMAGSLSAAETTTRILRRRIPASGDLLPVVGLGTWQGFDFHPGDAEYLRLPGVLDALFAAGGTVIDSSPMYGRAEESTGELLAVGNRQASAFLATKVWTRGRADGIRQIETSFRLLRAKRIDLFQIHNLLDWQTQRAVLRELKAAGRIRYIGITHYTASAYRELEAVMRAEAWDFLQVNYSLDEREAEHRILPLARDLGMAVLINRPFGGGGLLRRLRGRALPPWAAELGAATWAQVLLKFVLSQPAVTCAIPGTSRPEHMADNAAAGLGTIPDPGFWHRRLDDL